jgi:hypothetical protein
MKRFARAASRRHRVHDRSSAAIRQAPTCVLNGGRADIAHRAISACDTAGGGRLCECCDFLLSTALSVSPGRYNISADADRG